jgi:hypothetical protein
MMICFIKLCVLTKRIRNEKSENIKEKQISENQALKTDSLFKGWRKGANSTSLFQKAGEKERIQLR